MTKICGWANALSLARMVGAGLLFVWRPASAGFFATYALCVASDLLDGYIARRTHTASALGAVLDSLADLAFVGVLLALFVLRLNSPAWLLCWMAGIAALRLTSLAWGAAKYRAFAALHTYANKAAGAMLYAAPLLCACLGMLAAGIIVCAIATIASVEDLLITVTAKELCRNRKSLLIRAPHAL